MSTVSERGLGVISGLCGLAACCLAVVGFAGERTAKGPAEPVPYRVAAKLPDALETLSPAATRLGGFLGERVAVNATNRLLRVDEEPLLAGFRTKPGVHPWIGEHVGKWMHAATLAWANTGNPALREKIDRVAAGLIEAQEPDGYLGTYTPDKRFGLCQGADWDVWSHKYCLIGLLTHYQYTGDRPALEACRKVGDLLIATFGPGKKSILSAGTHVGMAATSVLEPVVLLYRFTGDLRYLDFARYIVQSWDEPNGPRIMATLLKEKAVSKTANGKAYEMLSNLVGLCELARATGEHKFLEPAIIAWEDIVEHRLYLTGSASQGEHFHGDYELPNRASANVAEMCVTTTWIQLNSQLFRLTGEVRFARELERTFYNHLPAAQRPDGAQWCYFTPLEGTKPYGPGINCCVSSGPRGMALVPMHAYSKFHEKDADGLAVSFYEPSEVTAKLDGVQVRLLQKSGFPRSGGSTVEVNCRKPARFALRFHNPPWTSSLELKVNGLQVRTRSTDKGWLEIPARKWKNGDKIELRYSLGGRLIEGDHGNTGLAALAWGPFILAYAANRNPEFPSTSSIGLASEARASSSQLVRLLPQAEGLPLAFETRVRSARRPGPFTATFVTFANAGSDGGHYRVWLRAPGSALPDNPSLLADGVESRSRRGNVDGSITDGEPGTFVVTFNQRRADEDWFQVSMPQPVSIRRVVFAHGKTFHDGGWFDSSGAKPQVQVKKTDSSPWESVGELTSYPATTATDSAGLTSGQSLTLQLTAPVEVVAVRVTGKPACGDNPQQAFSSCAELQAFER